MKEVQGVDLVVHGTKVAVYTTPNQQQESKTSKTRHISKQLRLSEELPINTERDVSSNNTYREVFKLKTARLSGSAVQTGLLKEIRESAEIEDLRRLLHLLGEERGGDGKGGGVVTSVDASKIYRDFYQVHYDFLRNVLEKS